MLTRFVKNAALRNWELMPSWGCIAWWAVIFGITVYCCFSKFEIWLDRSKVSSSKADQSLLLQPLPPWDWERCKDSYYKHHATFWDSVHGKDNSHNRLPELEMLQNEMLVAAKERGTR